MRQLRTRASRPRLFLVVAAISVITLAASSPIYSAVRGSHVTRNTSALPLVAARGTAAPDCSIAAASAAATAEHFGIDPGLGRTPINGVICGPFLGPGSQGMAAMVAVPAGCGVSQGWAVFRFAGGAWQLVMHQDNGALRLEAVGSDIRETQGYPRRGDAYCNPSRMRSRIWHWNGSSFVASPWKVTQAKTLHLVQFRSPSGNLACEFGGGGVRGVDCVSVKPARYVSLSPNGRVFICRTYDDPLGCLFNTKIFHDGHRIAAAPVLRYGQQDQQSGFVCDSEKTGITCRVRSGKGFLISRAGIRRVGP